LPHACRADCTSPRCGDGIQDVTEQCDEGEANSDTEPDACRESCARAWCGDGVVAAGEACDHGHDRAGDGGPPCAVQTGWTCTSGAGCSPICGDGVALGSEACDGNDFRGATCLTHGYTHGVLACRPNCTVDTVGCASSFCGNGIKEPGEACDTFDLGDAN